MRVMGFPLVYKQGPGLLETIGEEVRIFGNKALIVADPFIRNLYGDTLEKALARGGVDSYFADFSGQTSPKELDRLDMICREQCCNLVIGFGGGKSQDASKSVKMGCNVPVVIIPTSASNDAATSRMVIMYTEDGKFIGPKEMRTNPEGVFIDTAIIAKAPLKFLIAGIGDGLATYFEAMQCELSGVDNFFHGKRTETSLVIAKACFELIWNNAIMAVEAVKAGIITDELERVIEANVLLSGLGFEGCGVAASHGISLGYTLVDGITGLHGEEVAVGLITQFVLEGRDDAFIFDMLDFYKKVGLPNSLRALGLTEPKSEKISIIAKFASKEKGRTRNMHCEISEEIVYNAICRAEALSLEFDSIKD